MGETSERLSVSSVYSAELTGGENYRSVMAFVSMYDRHRHVTQSYFKRQIASLWLGLIGALQMTRGMGAVYVRQATP